MQKLTGFFTELMRRYLPDPFIFAMVLTLVTMAAAVFVRHQPVTSMVLSWGKGFWTLLAFTTQMALVLTTGYALAKAPLVDRLLDRVISNIENPRSAVVVATLVGAVGSYVNWGFGLVIGGIVARKLASRVKGVHYPLIIAAAYSGFTMYGLGLSASIPVLVSTAGHPLEKQMGVIPLSETIFSPLMLAVSAVVLITLPLLNAWLHPKPGDPVKELRIESPSDVAAPALENVDKTTIAYRLNSSRVLNYSIGGLGLIFMVLYVKAGGALDLNTINFVMLFLGIILLGTPIRYVAMMNEAIRTVSGMLLQYPFYAGIMAVIASSGLVISLSDRFTEIATASSLPFWSLISSFFLNFFVPGAGGHWIIQGPPMIAAAKALGASVSHTAMAVMLGNAWNDLIQPFWVLPALAISRLKLRDIMGYTMISMFWIGIVYSAAILLWK